MEQMNVLLPKMDEHTIDMDLRSCKPFIEKQVDWANDEEGHLHLRDGFHCPLCKNKGKIFLLRRDQDYGDTIAVKDCECVIKRNSIQFARKSGLGSLLNFRVNDYKTIDQWQVETKELAVKYITEKHDDWFCLLGQSGTGKTMLCSAIARTFIERSIETRYVVWPTWIKELKKNMLDDKTVLDKFMKISVLYIDDFFKGKITDVDITIAFDLLNYRYNNNLTTIITSELSFNQLMDIDVAVAGRIKERCGEFFKQIGNSSSKNYRLNQQKEAKV